MPGSAGPDQIGPFDKKAIGKGATGFTVGGEGWYRKHFRLDAYPVDARFELHFDGVYLECDVYLNGTRVGGSVHGYIPFALDLTPQINRASDNVIAVRVRNEGRNTRWYAGSGIYRPVTLNVLPATGRIAHWGVSAWTRRFANGRADVVVKTVIEQAQGLEVITRLRDGSGAVAAEARSPGSAQVEQMLKLKGPRLWSPDEPNLYTLETELLRGGIVIDRLEQLFGVRIVTFDPQRGMSINGKPTKVRGGCIHHDNGLLGACAYGDADERRIGLLKARGFNAIRSSHNPSSQTLRDACDRLGMLVIEEAFDAWHESKEPQDFATHFRDYWREVIEAMVLSRRNSPSIIMWSIGNEIPSRATDEGVEWEWKLANAVKQIDPTRPVTAGLNGVLGQEMVVAAGTARPGRAGKVDNASTLFIDVPGYNYRLEDIEPEHVTHPERVVYASETFAREVFDYAALSERAPYFLGEFLWTAMDYIGEAGLGATAFLKKGNPPFYFAAWPWVNAWCGDLDLIGQQKAASLARDVAWGLSPLELVAARPAPEGTYPWAANWGWPDEVASWNWPGQEGKQITVRAYTRAQKVQLLHNGKMVDEKTLSADDKHTIEATVPYAAGTLEAVAFVGGREVARRKLETVGPAAALRIVMEGPSRRKGREALAYARIEVVDAQGRVLPEDERMVSLDLCGAAELAAFGSANPRAVGSLRASQARTFRGRALAILRGTTGGMVTMKATSRGLPAASVSTMLA
ncbi:beta-galactosidase [Novosphingobium chloroacetimidivorans]|uniref:Beta-galactosidase n=1 Tax=Novosphingobium chloroacetimidivorans TaxID=1428314 RepID=A0A7W7NXH6_9SPHN|nr:beta-galactosidase [Novosphingobium chloroacetimidivorans]